MSMLDEGIPAIDPEEEELLELRAILNELYKDRTILLKEPRRLSHVPLVIDLTHYCTAYCSTCKTWQPFHASATERWVYLRCDVCNEELLDLQGNV